MQHHSTELQKEDREQIRENLSRVRHRIEKACEAGGRDPEEVTLCVVTKGRPAGAIQAVVEEGVSLIGENRVQEAEKKYRFFPDNARLHMIGHLQTNKVSLAVRLFEGVQSVDRPKLVEYLQRHCAKRNLTMPVFLQVNVSGEETKHGVDPDDLPSLCERTLNAEALSVKGLMTLAPYMEDPENTRPIFRKLRTLRDDLRDRFSEEQTPLELSMGMSQDYHIAVEEGATMVRPGTAVFSGTSFE